LIKVFLQKSWESFFLYLGFISFLVMMMFGHPFRYHALVFSILGVVSLLFPKEKCIVSLSKRSFIFIFIGLCAFLDVSLARHFVNMANIGKFQERYVRLEKIDLDGYKDLEAQYLKNSLEDNIYSWKFKHELYSRIVTEVFFDRNKDLANYLIPDLLEYSEKNRFAVISYDLARTYYSLGEYEKAKLFSTEAVHKKPDENKYFDLLHLNNVMLISINNHIPLRQLLSPEHFEKLSDAHIIHPSQIGPDGVALR